VITINMNLRNSSKNIENKMSELLAEMVNRRIRSKQRLIVRDIRVLIYEWVASQPEIIDIRAGVEGELAPNFGIPEGEEQDIANKICLAAASSFSVNIKNLNSKTLIGNVNLRFGNRSFRDLLELPEGVVLTENGQNLHWMNWLLFAGNESIVVGYNFLAKEGKGRSGGGIMRKGNIWRVPPAFAGTQDDNFLTRAMNNPNNEQQIQEVLKRHLE
jgi:hypothetical protein